MKNAKGRLKIEITRFFLVGAVNFVITLVIFYSLLRIVKIDYLLALTVSWIVGLIFSYTVNFVWVFKPESQLQFRKRFIRYFVANGVSFTLNIFLLSIAVDTFKWDPFISQFALIPVVVCFNFLTAKYWSLHRHEKDN